MSKRRADSTGWLPDIGEAITAAIQADRGKDLFAHRHKSWRRGESYCPECGLRSLSGVPPYDAERGFGVCRATWR